MGVRCNAKKKHNAALICLARRRCDVLYGMLKSKELFCAAGLHRRLGRVDEGRRPRRQPRDLRDDPHLEDAMTGAGFYPKTNRQPVVWVNRHGIPVDLMVSSALSNRTSPTGRSPRLPPHAKNAMRIATGLEGCVVDNTVMTITALDNADHRAYDVRVAGTAALRVAKIHERLDTPGRLQNKDAHDIYRIPSHRRRARRRRRRGHRILGPERRVEHPAQCDQVRPLRRRLWELRQRHDPLGVHTHYPL
ncbi:hypothetical protein [Rhodococcus koreensis]|uniref:hypothetical protein n=1 Tax=Rhodococcus koreensis TaxID=99653 RepID=UPI0036DB17A9